MRVTLATGAGSPAWPNEDFAAVSPTAAVLTDGATRYPIGCDTGCVHGTAWFARALAAAMLAAITAEPPPPLRGALAGAISEIRARHERTCDLAHPKAPAATVAAIRAAGDQVDYLVLSDSAVIADHEDGGPEVITLPTHPSAGADPLVVAHAQVGAFPLAGLRGAAVLSDGATRIVARYGVLTWPQILAVTRDAGPGELIRQVRAAEDTDPDGVRWPRRKDRDDATALYLRFE
jgi:hypothetical protein